MVPRERGRMEIVVRVAIQGHVSVVNSPLADRTGSSRGGTPSSVDWMSGRGQPVSQDESDLEQQARLEERNFNFRQAFHHFVAAADELPADAQHVDRRAQLLHCAARCLEMREPWRAVAGSWEWLGNLLGATIDAANGEPWVANRYKVPSPAIPHEFFYVASDDQWERPAGGIYVDKDHERRHRRASSYEWGANHALAGGQHADAARLYRRAGVAWEQSERPDRLKRAQECYYRAAMSASETGRVETNRGILEPWCAGCLREKSQEERCAKQNHPSHFLDDSQPGEGAESDLQRIKRCGMARLAQTDEERAGVYREYCNQLAAIQRAVATRSSRSDAIKVYRFRNDVELDFLSTCHGFPWKRAWLVSRKLFSKGGSSVGRASLCLVLLYFLVLPLVWWVSGAVDVVDGVDAGPGWIEAIVFSASTLTTLTGRYEPGTWNVNLAQALQAVSAVFGLGYLLWISQRSYED